MPGEAGEDRRAVFEHVALPHAPALYRTARRLSRRTADAGDLVQETFLRAYRTFDNFQAGTNAKAWLFTIMYSIMANIWRRDQRLPEEVPMEDVELRFGYALASDAVDAERELLSRIDASPEIDVALRQLPQAYRDAVCSGAGPARPACRIPRRRVHDVQRDRRQHRTDVRSTR